MRACWSWEPSTLWKRVKSISSTRRRLRSALHPDPGELPGHLPRIVANLVIIGVVREQREVMDFVLPLVTNPIAGHLRDLDDPVLPAEPDWLHLPRGEHRDDFDRIVDGFDHEI